MEKEITIRDKLQTKMGRPAKATKIQETPFRNRGQGSLDEEKSKQMVQGL